MERGLDAQLCGEGWVWGVDYGMSVDEPSRAWGETR
jgi:hypothetical protein